MSTEPGRLRALLRPPVDENPLVDEAPPLTLGQVVRRFWPYLRRVRAWLVVIGAVLVAAPLIEIAEILLFERLVDDVLVPADLGALTTLAILFVVLNLVSAVVSGVDDYVSTMVSQRFLIRLRTDVFSHVVALPTDAHDRRRLGDVISRVTSDVASVESFMLGKLTDGIGSILRLVFFIVALFVLQWELALAAVIVVPFFWWVALSFSRFIKVVSRERRRRAGSLTSVTEESLANVSVIQAFNREPEAVTEYHRHNLAIARAELAGARIRSIFLPLSDFAELVGTLVVIGLGTWALATDRLTLGGLLAFLALMAQCYRPLRQLADLLPSLFSATASIERVVELLDDQTPTDRPDARPLDVPRGEIRFEGVSVRYPGAPRAAVSDLSLTIQPGKVVVVTGESGSGKSTLTRLLTRHVAPTEGTVLIDDNDIAHVTAHSLREAVALLPQETLLQDATLAENIAFARPGATREQVEAAARAADVTAFAERLPHGLDTRIGQRGRTLSGGQRQRLAMARALLRDPRILLLDEPTTGLDPATARRVLEPVLTSMRGRTVLIFTHDPVVVEYAEEVVALDPPRRTPETVPC